MYMYKQDLALNNLQGLIYHKIQPTKPVNIPRILVCAWTNVCEVCQYELVNIYIFIYIYIYVCVCVCVCVYACACLLTYKCVN